MFDISFISEQEAAVDWVEIWKGFGWDGADRIAQGKWLQYFQYKMALSLPFTYIVLKL